MYLQASNLTTCDRGSTHSDIAEPCRRAVIRAHRAHARICVLLGGRSTLLLFAEALLTAEHVVQQSLGVDLPPQAVVEGLPLRRVARDERG